MYQRLKMQMSWFFIKNRFYAKWKQLKLRRKVQRPICYLLGHKLWQDNGWSGGYERCHRCDHFKVIYRSKTT